MLNVEKVRSSLIVVSRRRGSRLVIGWGEGGFGGGFLVRFLVESCA